MPEERKLRSWVSEGQTSAFEAENSLRCWGWWMRIPGSLAARIVIAPRLLGVGFFLSDPQLPASQWHAFPAKRFIIERVNCRLYVVLLLNWKCSNSKIVVPLSINHTHSVPCSLITFVKTHLVVNYQYETEGAVNAMLRDPPWRFRNEYQLHEVGYGIQNIHSGAWTLI